MLLLFCRINFLDAQIPAELATEDINRPCEYIEPSPADGGTLSHEVERFIRHINDIETECASVQLLGHPSKKRSEEPQDLRANSYVCLGGRHGLHRQDCLVYSFG